MPDIKKNLFSIIVIIALVAYILYQRIPIYLANSRLEDREVSTDLRFMTLDGQVFTLRDFEGKLVVINFWATWCLPCKVEMPLLENTYRNYKEDVIILGVTGEDPDTVRNYLKNNEVSYPIVMDSDYAITDYFGIQAYPSIIIIRGNKIVDASTGLNPLIRWKIRWYAKGSLL